MKELKTSVAENQSRELSNHGVIFLFFFEKHMLIKLNLRKSLGTLKKILGEKIAKKFIFFLIIWVNNSFGQLMGPCGPIKTILINQII